MMGRRGLGWAVLVLISACATTPDNWGGMGSAGPMVGYVVGRGMSFGWEAGGGALGSPSTLTSSGPHEANLIFHGNMGMSWRPTPQAGGYEPTLYMAWEPGLGPLGATLGYSYASLDGPRPLGGGWAAVGRPSSLVLCKPCWTASVALGWRWNGVSEFYLTPKIGFIDGVRFSWGD